MTELTHTLLPTLVDEDISKLITEINKTSNRLRFLNHAYSAIVKLASNGSEIDLESWYMAKETISFELSGVDEICGLVRKCEEKIRKRQYMYAEH